MTSRVLSMNPRHQPLQPSEASAFCFYAVIHRVMHQPLSRFSACRGKRVDYIGTSQQKTRQIGVSLQTSSVRHVYALQPTTTQNGSSAVQDRLPAKGIYHARCSLPGCLPMVDTKLALVITCLAFTPSVLMYMLCYSFYALTVAWNEYHVSLLS